MLDSQRAKIVEFISFGTKLAVLQERINWPFTKSLLFEWFKPVWNGYWMVSATTIPEKVVTAERCLCGTACIPAVPGQSVYSHVRSLLKNWIGG